jgi:NAD(P)-dependent dehydrogenase (short-subunit alcohol dehydrogenase family)
MYTNKKIIITLIVLGLFYKIKQILFQNNTIISLSNRNKNHMILPNFLSLKYKNQILESIKSYTFSVCKKNIKDILFLSSTDLKGTIIESIYKKLNPSKYIGKNLYTIDLYTSNEALSPFKIIHYGANNKINQGIDWHIDKKITNGDEYNMIITLFDTSDSIFIYKSDKTIKFYKLPILSAEIHNKGKIPHKVIKQTYGERISLVFSYSTHQQKNTLTNKISNIYHNIQLYLPINKKCLVIGGINGIGGEIVRILNQINCDVYILGRINDSSKNILKKEKYIDCDLADMKSVFKAIINIKNMNIKFDEIYFNAGIDYRPSITTYGFNETFQVNVLSQFIIFKLCIKNEFIHTESKILFISSLRSRFCSNNNILNKAILGKSNNYGETKLIINMIGNYFSREKNMNIVCIHPGIVDTNLMKRHKFKKIILDKMYNLITPTQSCAYILNIFYSKPKWNGEYIEITKGGVIKYINIKLLNNEINLIINQLDIISNKIIHKFNSPQI